MHHDKEICNILGINSYKDECESYSPLITKKLGTPKLIPTKLTYGDLHRAKDIINDGDNEWEIENECWQGNWQFCVYGHRPEKEFPYETAAEAETALRKAIEYVISQGV